MNAIADDVKARADDQTPRGMVRRWLGEIELSERRFGEFWKEADDLYDIYEGKKKVPYNVLGSNTEVLRPAIYNSVPNPDVRRRYRDDDVLGKTVSKVLQRALDYTIDDYENEDFDSEMKDIALDVLITGRGVARVKYIPVFVPMEGAPAAAVARPGEASALPPSGVPEDDLGGDPTMDLEAQPQQIVGDESANCEYVHYRNFIHSAGKKWSHVWWVGFIHELDRDELIRMFGPDIGIKVPLDESHPDEKVGDKDLSDMGRTARVYEIWDKRTRTCMFFNKQTEEAPLLVAPDPLALTGFFPTPKPIYAVENTRSLIPIPPYRLYEAQARELNLVSTRINKIVTALKVRGAYASNIDEVKNILSGDDNDMIPIANVTEISAAGGLDKAIWMMPIDHLARTLKELYLARIEIKQVIAELTGISDIIRGSTDPNETKGAQQLKSQWGTLRLQRIQRDVQRYARDIIRLLGEIISSQFSPEKLAAITQVELPDQQMKDQAQAQLQMMQQAPPQMDPMTGQPAPPQQPPPEMLEMMQLPTWDEVMQVLKSDELRGYKVDVETDSTVAETIERDMTGLAELMQSIGQVIQIFGPLVQQGMMPLDAAKEIVLSIVRRARLGNAVEDQIASIGGQQQQAALAQAQAPQEQMSQQIMQMIQQLGQKGDDMGNGIQNGMQEISNQIQVALENLGRQNQLRAVS